MNQKIGLISLLFCVIAGHTANGQAIPSGQAGDKLIAEALDESLIRRNVEFLTDSLCEGRATSTRGAVEAASWMARQFRSCGLMPLGSSYFKSFQAGDRAGHNVLGFSPASYPTGKYVIIAAHYDNIGILNDNLYPGADSNASGVAAMLALARLNRGAIDLGQLSTCNIIFAGLDAKQLSMAGADALYYDIAAGRVRDPKTGIIITPDRISMMVNLDILGGTDRVDQGRHDYLIMLGGKAQEKDALQMANYSSGAMLDLSYDYFGSKNFTDLFLKRLGDQKVFLEHKVNSVLFTSGITMKTNTQEDTCDSLDIPVLRRRILLIYKWLEKILG